MLYFFQCPPFRLSYQGLGEPLCFAAFGPFSTTAFYFANSSKYLTRFIYKSIYLLMHDLLNWATPFEPCYLNFQRNKPSPSHWNSFVSVCSCWVNNHFYSLLQPFSPGALLILCHLSIASILHC